MKTAASSALFNHQPSVQLTCPECKESLSGVALVDIVYEYVECNCGSLVHVHLVEQAHHKSCYILYHTK